MQRHCTELTDRLLQSVDEEYNKNEYALLLDYNEPEYFSITKETTTTISFLNVLNMQVVLEVIQALEKIVITKEVLEATRLGKHINELRRKTSCERLAKRAKDLVRKWRQMVIPSTNSTPQPTLADTAPPALNGTSAQCPALRGLKPASPALKGLKPQSPLLKTTALSRVSSPCLSLNSDQSRSPIVSPCKPHAPQVEAKVCSQNHLQEAVPRTHSSNKRLRKDEPNQANEPANKKQRLNGENVSSSNTNSQVPSPTLKERNPELVEPSLDTESNVVKKRGRKKGSKSVKKTLSTEDSVKEKLASISRNPKLKTTQELLADLQARGSNLNANSLPSHSVNAPNIDDVLRTRNNVQVGNHLPGNQSYLSSSSQKGNIESNAKDERIKADGNFANAPKRYHESDTPDEDTRDSVNLPEDDTRLPQDLTVEEILAKLPPLDLESIDWNDDYYEKESQDSDKMKEVAEEDLERLHTECIEGLNGNFQPNLDSIPEKSVITETCKDKVKFDGVVGLRRPSDSHKDEIFREWHEMLARPTFDGQILHILPYVIID